MCKSKAVLVLSLVLVVLSVFAIAGISCAPNGISCAPKPAPLPAPPEPAPVEPAPVEPAPVKPAPVKSALPEPAPVEPAPVEPAPVKPAPPEPAPVKPTPPEPIMRIWTLNDAEATRLLVKPISGSSIHFMPENKAVLRYYFIRITPTVGVSEGRLWFDGIPPWIHSYVKPMVGSYTSYSEGKLFLTELPPWFDPTEDIAPDVTELPTFESITTAEGKAIITYVWP